MCSASLPPMFLPFSPTSSWYQSSRLMVFPAAPSLGYNLGRRPSRQGAAEPSQINAIQVFVVTVLVKSI